MIESYHQMVLIMEFFRTVIFILDENSITLLYHDETKVTCVTHQKLNIEKYLSFWSVEKYPNRVWIRTKTSRPNAWWPRMKTWWRWHETRNVLSVREDFQSLEVFRRTRQNAREKAKQKRHRGVLCDPSGGAPFWMTPVNQSKV